jgi:hypothetical protein
MLHACPCNSEYRGHDVHGTAWKAMRHCKFTLFPAEDVTTVCQVPQLTHLQILACGADIFNTPYTPNVSRLQDFVDSNLGSRSHTAGACGQPRSIVQSPHDTDIFACRSWAVRVRTAPSRQPGNRTSGHWACCSGKWPTPAGAARCRTLFVHGAATGGGCALA